MRNRIVVVLITLITFCWLVPPANAAPAEGKVDTASVTLTSPGYAEVVLTVRCGPGWTLYQSGLTVLRQGGATSWDPELNHPYVPCDEPFTTTVTPLCCEGDVLAPGTAWLRITLNVTDGAGNVAGLLVQKRVKVRELSTS